MRHLRRLLLGLWVLAPAGCGDSLPFVPGIVADYSSPTATLLTIEKGIEDKGATNGQAVYLGAFADSLPVGGDGRAFHAFFDPLDLATRPSWDPNRDWNKDLERVMYLDLAGKFVNPYEMSWEPYEPAGNDTGSDTDSLLHRKYRIRQLVGSAGMRSPVAIGAVDLYFVRSTGTPNRWVIASWQDYRTLDADSAVITLGRRRLDTQ